MNMKVIDNEVLNENILDDSELSPESKFIKNILLKVKSNSKVKVDESYMNESNLKTICEDFNAKNIIITPVNSDDIVLAYDPHIEICDESFVLITGDSHKGKLEGLVGNVMIKIPIKKFFESVVIS